MSKPKRTSKRQLSLIDQFDAVDLRKHRLSDSLISLIKDFKYYRTMTRASHMKESNIAIIDLIVYNLAALAYKQGVKDGPFFKKIIKDGCELSVAEPMLPNDVEDMYHTGAMKTRATIMTNKDIIREDLEYANKILSSIDRLLKN